MDLKLPKITWSQTEEAGFGIGLLISTFGAVVKTFFTEFPIAQVNDYLYGLVMLLTLAIGIKRIIGWFFKSKKVKSNEHD